MDRLLLIAAFGVWLTVCGAWIWIFVLQVYARRQRLFLSAVLNAHPTGGASVRVIVPVRNSGGRVAPCVQSILQQDYGSIALTLVDDRSEDDSAQQLATLARGDPRVQILQIADLPSGWLGKSHALWNAANTAGEEWLLFLDDDCILDPPAVSAGLVYASGEELDLLTLWPRHLAGGFWEHLLIPLCGAMIAMWFGSPGVNSRGSSQAFANGQFLLIRRTSYLAIDGHRSVRDAIIEDVPLAEHAKRSGLRCRVACGADLFGVRMYDSCGGIREGWARIFVGALRSRLRLAATMLWLFFGNLWPFLATPVAAWIAWNAPAGGSRAGVAALTIGLGMLHIALIVLVSYRFWGYGHCRRSYLCLYPFSVAGVMCIVAQAWWLLAVRKRIDWRDTSYAIDSKARLKNARSRTPRRSVIGRIPAPPASSQMPQGEESCSSRQA